MNTELERAAYMAGDTELARLYDRIELLQQALGRAVAELSSIDNPECKRLADELEDLC